VKEIFFNRENLSFELRLLPPDAVKIQPKPRLLKNNQIDKTLEYFSDADYS
jgi:hypothetical protein